MHTSSKWRFYKICICRVCEQIIARPGAGVVLIHKREQHSSCAGGCQKEFSIELVAWSENRSLGFYQVQISKNPSWLTVIPRTSDDILKCNYTVRRKKHWIQQPMNLLKRFSFYRLSHLVHSEVHSEANTCTS